MRTQIYAKIFIEDMCMLTLAGSKEQVQYVPSLDYEDKDPVFITKADIRYGKYEFFDKESDFDEYCPVLMDEQINLPYYMRRIF